MSLEKYSMTMPRTVYSGMDALENLKTIVKDAKKVAIFTDRGILSTGLVDLPLAKLQEAGKETIVISDLPPEPTYMQVQKLVDEFKASGADFIVAVGGGSATPSFAVASQQELYDHYCAVAAHVDTPIVLYNIPARTGNKLLPEAVCRLAKDVEVIKGAKDSSGDWENLKAHIQLTKDLDFSVLSGNDSLILPALKEGGVGGIAGCSNVYPKVLSSIYELFQEGKLDEAQAAQDSIASFRAVFKYGNPNTVVKTAVAMLGYNVGKCRAPFNQLPQEGLEALEKVLQENKDKGMC